MNKYLFFLCSLALYLSSSTRCMEDKQPLQKASKDLTQTVLHCMRQNGWNNVCLHPDLSSMAYGQISSPA